MQRPWTASVVVPVQERRSPEPDTAVEATDPPAAQAGDDAAGQAADRAAAALLDAADVEADALADRLHDGALQALVVARYAADAAVRGGDAALARDAVQDALVALRRAVWLIRPRGADGLATALAELSAQRVAAGAPPLDLHVDAPAADSLAPVARATAYRFVQACAPEAVHVAPEGAEVVVSVPGAVADAAGWTARAGALGGRLHVDDATSRLVLPVTDPSSEGDR